MQPRHIDCLIPAQPDHAFPFQLQQRASRMSAVFFLALLIPAAIIMLIPLGFIATSVFIEHGLNEAAKVTPWTLVLSTIGLTIWCSLWAFPIHGYWSRLTQSRQIEISSCGQINVIDRSALGTRQWTCAVKDFDGICHHVRSSLSGTRHELSLKQAGNSNSLVLHIAPIITDIEALHLARFLDCPVVGAPIVEATTPVHISTPPRVEMPVAVAA